MVTQRTLIIVCCNLLLVFLVQLVNHSISSTRLAFFPYGLLLVFAALNFTFSQGLFITILTGLWLDGSFPSPFGWFLFLLILLFALAYRLRGRLHREKRSHFILLALGLNTALFLLATLFLGRPFLGVPLFWLRSALDLLLSTCLLLFIARWFHDLQLNSLHLVGIHIYEEEVES